ncbi:MAG: condensation domain-containing protein, partial [Candidatus Aminicenantes bacterium]|nr:condensation domain-containing protein [Candidatus Aminicenantes bacterium]
WIDFPYIHMVRIYPNTEMERIALRSGVSKEAVLGSEGLAYHEWSPTSPFEKSFTQNYQAEFLSDYFLNKKRLLHVLGRQMKVLTEADIVQKYHSYLPVEIESLDDLLKFTGIGREELGAKNCQADDAMQVVGFNQKLAQRFFVQPHDKDALRILLLDLSQYFSADGMLFDVVESPLGLISLLTYLNQRLGSKIHGKIAKARADFDNYAQLKKMIEDFKPHLIGVRTLTFYKDFFHRTLAVIRHWGINVPIAAGGPYASSDYNTILQDANIDIVVRGEGEITFFELIDNMIKNGGKLPGDNVLQNIPGLVFVQRQSAGSRQEAARKAVENGVREIIMWDHIFSTPCPVSETGADVEPRCGVSDPIQIIYTTPGSEDKEQTKRVEATQAGVLALLSNLSRPDVPSACFLFDGGVHQVFSALCRGARLIILPEHLRVNHIRLLEYYKTPAFNIRLLLEKSISTDTPVKEAIKKPKDEIERQILKIWSDILAIGEEKISTDANFFDLGGHSLRATTLVSRIHKEFDVKVPLAEVFKFPTVSDISIYIKSLERETFIAIETAIEKEYYALSSAQKRLYIQQFMQLESIIYNLPTVMRLAGKINKDLLEEVFKKLISRHESLRTSFHQVDGEALQKINRPEEIKFEIEFYAVGKSRQTEEGREAPIHDLIERFIRPFDLTKAPLLRVCLIETGAEEHIFLVDMHHIVTDGTSMGILVKEFMALYSGETLPPLHIRYRDFSEWQNRMFLTPEFKKQADYWLEQFAGPLPAGGLPGDFAVRKSESAGGRYVFFEIDPQSTSMIKRLAADTESTLFIVLLAVHTILLAKYSGREDIVVGTGIAGRRHADLENVIGLFINMLALRSRPEKGKTFLNFLAEVKQTALAAYANQDYQYEELIRTLDLQGKNADNQLFETIFQVQNMEIPELKIPGLVLKSYNYEFRISRHPLIIYATEVEDKISLMMLYAARVFLHETAEKLAQRFLEVVEQVVKNPAIKIQDIALTFELEKLETPALQEEQGDFKF